MRREALLFVLVGLVLVLVPAGGASAASQKKCSRAPKGRLAPIRGLKAGYATSCSTARKVVADWIPNCEDTAADLCSARAAGKRWSCRANAYPEGPPQPLPLIHRPFELDLYVRCALKETTKGRPVVNFHQTRVGHACARPDGTAAAIRFLSGYYKVHCAKATQVARAWDSACDPGADRSTCDFTSDGAQWSCVQNGDEKYTYLAYVCTNAQSNNGR